MSGLREPNACCLFRGFLPRPITHPSPQVFTGPSTPPSLSHSVRLSFSSLLPRVIVALPSRLTSASESTQAMLRTTLNSIIAA